MNKNPAISRFYARDAQMYGSAQWADRPYLKTRGYGQNGRKFFGYGVAEHRKAGSFAITSNSNRHTLRIGPTRSHKGTCGSIRKCLDHQGPLVAMDVKGGEMALIAARCRRDVLGRNVVLVDPRDCAASRLGMRSLAFNPLDWADPLSDTFVDDNFLIGDSTIMSRSEKDPHWADEAVSLIAGLSMHVKTSPLVLLPCPEEGRNLGQVRNILNLGPAAFKNLVAGEFTKDEDGKVTLLKPGMAQSKNKYVRAAAGRILNKSERERSGVISTAQSNTHFLEGPINRKILAKSDFDPRDLERGDMDIFFILPAGRIQQDARLTRLFVSVFLTIITRFKKKPEIPVCMLVEECAALKRLEPLETAMGLLAGLGVELDLVWQDLNQLAGIYNESWQSFIANCSEVQCLGTNDNFTAEYISKRSGIATVENLSYESAQMRAGLFGDPSYLSTHDQLVQRPLITADEIMTAHPVAQYLFLANAHPAEAYKAPYYLDRCYRNKKDEPLFSIHPDYEGRALPRSIDFTKPGLDIGAALAPFMVEG